MSKHTIKGFVYHVQYDFQEKGQACWNSSETMGRADPDWTLVGPHDFEVEIPDDFDPRLSKVAALKAKKEQLRAEFAKSVRDLDEQLNKLLCLENTAGA